MKCADSLRLSAPPRKSCKTGQNQVNFFSVLAGVRVTTFCTGAGFLLYHTPSVPYRFGTVFRSVFSFFPSRGLGGHQQVSERGNWNCSCGRTFSREDISNSVMRLRSTFRRPFTYAGQTVCVLCKCIHGIWGLQRPTWCVVPEDTHLVGVQLSPYAFDASVLVCGRVRRCT